HVAIHRKEDAYEAVLFEGDSDALLGVVKQIDAQAGSIVPVQCVATGTFDRQPEELADNYLLERLVHERTVSVNTAAAGGNANLMTLG
ncbi:hypothetical protein P0D75_43135, partial [Paraburkholderia sediminicola]